MLEAVTRGTSVTEAVSVLLIEDDAADALIVSEYMTEAGLRASLTWSRSLSAAEQQLAAAPDCILLDLNLPDARGFDGLRTVLRMAPDAAVLVFTGVADTDLGVAAVAAGAQDYLVKGQVDGQALGRSVRYAVERKRADEGARRLHASELRQAEYQRLERGLLPVPIVTDPRIYHALCYRPGRHQALLGGDFYDLIELGDGTLHLLIGDVSGHGPDEAALGVCLRVAWRTLVLAGQDPARMLPSMHDVLVRERHSEEVFATVAMLSLDVASGAGSLRLAGHPAPVRLGPVPRLLANDGTGVPLGMFDGDDWPGTGVQLGSHWSLVLYTDGLIEGRGPAGEILGYDGLLGLIAGAAADPAHPRYAGALADELLAQAELLNGEELADDVAVLVVGRHR